jgi:hypothetical protein
MTLLDAAGILLAPALLLCAVLYMMRYNRLEAEALTYDKPSSYTLPTEVLQEILARNAMREEAAQPEKSSDPSANAMARALTAAENSAVAGLEVRAIEDGFKAIAERLPYEGKIGVTKRPVKGADDDSRKEPSRWRVEHG